MDSRAERWGFWDVYSLTYDAINLSITYRRHLEALGDALALAPGLRVLDLGCGTGNLECALAGRAAGLTFVGVDSSVAMIGRASRKCRRLPVEFLRGDISRPLPFEDASFDRIAVNNVLYTLSDRRAFFAELSRLLRPGGLLVLSDPKVGAQVGPLVKAHLEAVSRMPLPRRVAGYVQTAVMLPLTGLAPMLLSAAVIGGAVKKGEYRFSRLADLLGLLDEFDAVEITSAYAEQSWLAVARKACPAQAALAHAL